jgi:hypothetical protein
LDNQAERLLSAAGYTAETVLPEGETFYTCARRRTCPPAARQST